MGAVACKDKVFALDVEMAFLSAPKLLAALWAPQSYKNICPTADWLPLASAPNELAVARKSSQAYTVWAFIRQACR
ncbi:hypothetical protein TREES_T100000955 [Tupaia chinensis]|uniref:Uncharacterized protein n=1 Tax=Tupaia chinensis TaxID=246437 RepID=L9JCV2_TUPCH|nr:hypothetical protein TREES_T100000955 [Tupaia chinensis]